MQFYQGMVFRSRKNSLSTRYQACAFHGGAAKSLKCLNIGNISRPRQDADLLARLASSGDGNIIA